MWKAEQVKSFYQLINFYKNKFCNPCVHVIVVSLHFGCDDDEHDLMAKNIFLIPSPTPYP